MPELTSVWPRHFLALGARDRRRGTGETGVPGGRAGGRRLAASPEAPSSPVTVLAGMAPWRMWEGGRPRGGLASWPRIAADFPCLRFRT